MASVKVTKDIGAPVETVFELFTDVQHGPQHVSGIKGIKLLTPGRFALGTRWAETRQVLGRLDEAEMEITSFEKNRGYTVTHHKGGVRIDTEFRFEATKSNTTEVSIEFALDPHGLPPGILAPLEWAIAGKVRGVLTQDLADLKVAIERVSGTTREAVATSH
jgi:uncharacterized membrane protein